jgi:acyl carrier protein
MGLDFVELIISIEDAFDVSIGEVVPEAKFIKDLGAD